ncbi:MAG: serine hydrolase, partial [Saprospiraceae bacterium]|nr:serine hydrolase [Saprospiraceae bacterium]
LLLIPALGRAQSSLPKELKGLDEFVEMRMKEWNVPGVAIAVVRDSQVVLTKGYGWANVEGKQRVDAGTLFAIGSSSKAFTATGVMQLVDEGKVDLDEPVITYVPNLRLYNDELTNNLTVRDLLCHRSGLPRHDVAWYGSGSTREELIAKMAYLEPNAQLRETWQYQNFMFMAAGYLIEQVTGQSWEAYTQKHLFDPLQMSNSNFSVIDLQKTANRAWPYQEEEGEVKVMEYRNIDAIGPAGSINSNATDMANWLILQLNEGRFQGKQVISGTSLHETHKPQMVMPGDMTTDEIFYSSYGLGWMITSYRGHLRVEHGGNIDGFSASVCVMPRDGIGIVVLTNMNGTALTGVIRNYIVDKMLDLEVHDWNTELLEQRNKAREASLLATEEEEDLARVNGTAPSHAPADYVGLYRHPGYGQIEVRQKDDGSLEIGLNELGFSDLVHYHYDVFKVESAFGQLKFQFAYDLRGKISQLSSRLEPSLDAPIVFEKLAPELALSIEALKIYEGDYEVMGVTAEVRLHDDVLELTVPGQPTYTLVATKEHEFDLKDIEGYSVVFGLEDGAVTSMSFIQPNGTFKATKK